MKAKCSVVQPDISNIKQSEQSVYYFFWMLQMHNDNWKELDYTLKLVLKAARYREDFILFHNNKFRTRTHVNITADTTYCKL